MNLLSISENDINEFQRKILVFYKEHKRDLPWRKTKDPYRILVSEFMLQQTQVSRVIDYYTKWMKKWPTVKSLATAPYKEVLAMWMGLGYNRRAMYLQKTAKIIMNEYNGDVLEAVKHVEKLPGIGPYTSKAIQIFSSNANIATVDTNIRRIFIKEFDMPESITDKELFQLAEQCLPKGKSRDWHNALMDYGSLYLTSKKTGIKPKTQQSRFQGSDRQIRGQILRLLLKETHSFYEIKDKIDVDDTRLETILDKMQQEKTIDKKNDSYLVPN